MRGVLEVDAHSARPHHSRPLRVKSSQAHSPKFKPCFRDSTKFSESAHHLGAVLLPT